MSTPGSRRPSNHQRPIEIHARFGSVVFDAVSPVAAEKVKSKAVLLRIKLLHKAEFQSCPLLRIHHTLEHGMLNPLPEVQAGLRNSVQSPPAGGIDRRHVIAYQYEQDTPSGSKRILNSRQRQTYGG
jgi:hypothetical protein